MIRCLADVLLSGFPEEEFKNSSDIPVVNVKKNVSRKPVLEGGWVQKKLKDVGWSDESECQACYKEEGAEKAQALPLPRMIRGQTGDPRGFQKVGADGENVKKRTGSGKEVLLRILSVKKPMEQGPFQREKVGVREAQEVEHANRRLSRGTLLLTAPSWVLLGSGEHAVGQWCSWIMMKNWGLAWDVRLHGGSIGSPADRLEDRADGIPLPSQESYCAHQGACRQ